MKRGSKFLVTFITASLTFGSLMAFVGPQYSGFNRYGYHYHGGWYHHHHSNYYYEDERCPLPEGSEKKQ